jgi:hypothetical protein
LTIQRRVFKTQERGPAETPADAPAEPAGEVSEAGPADVVAPTPETALQRVQQSLAGVAEVLGRLGRERDAALLADDDAEVARLDEEMAQQNQMQRRLTDKIALMAAEASRLEVELAAADREARITELEAILARRDKAAEDLQLHLCKAEAAFRKVHELGQAARNGWAWPHGRAGGVLASGQDLFWGVSSFLYKIGGRAGQTSPDGPPTFPGARCPRLELLGKPEALPDLADEFRAASKFASDVMRGVTASAPTPEPATAGTDEQPAPVVATAGSPSVPPISPEVAQLLVLQSVLAARDMSAADEEEYRRNGEQIAALSAS